MKTLEEVIFILILTLILTFNSIHKFILRIFFLMTVKKYMIF